MATLPASATDEIPELRVVAETIAHEVGGFAHRERPVHLDISTKSSPTDVATAMDRAAEARIRAMLVQLRPDDGLLGEEGAALDSASGITWVVDPIDGTTNYLYGLPMWAVSIAAVRDGEVLAGAVHAPALGLLFTAGLHLGASVVTAGVRRDMRCSIPAGLSQSLVATGFGYTAERRERQGRVLADLVASVRDVRRAGAAALDMCWVAEGKLDAYYERGTHVWDVAAGLLIAREAGAVVQSLSGSLTPLVLDVRDLPTVVAASPTIAPGLVDRLRAAGADGAETAFAG
jgi:myo-inositol-1(or 4)-monophosphatase